MSSTKPELVDLEDEDEENAPEHETVRAKWSLDGASTLAKAAQKARGLADWLQGLHDQGYVLEDEIADDYGFYFKP